MRATTNHLQIELYTPLGLIAHNQISPEHARSARPHVTKKRRPRNAFILYRTVPQAKPEFKGKTQTELSRLISASLQN